MKKKVKKLFYTLDDDIPLFKINNRTSNVSIPGDMSPDSTRSSGSDSKPGIIFML